jgi:hypothetical protein
MTVTPTARNSNNAPLAIANHTRTMLYAASALGVNVASKTSCRHYSALSLVLAGASVLSATGTHVEISNYPSSSTESAEGRAPFMNINDYHQTLSAAALVLTRGRFFSKRSLSVL